ncbi:hypothetical protein KI688_008008 [Linnemannia hyalina]|uniref:Uncharacterized protein n=1 Tax=Linnemannia hyalina TaxID=64524 RepID=A0A9P7Y0G1_9FUNG|nr:hypothetical protein KI688_008008 [Linnemannia hyalina]
MSRGATSDDKEFLKEICLPIPREMTEDATSNTLPSQDSITLGDDDDTFDRQVQFIGWFMRYIYSNNYPRNTGIGTMVNRFIMRSENMKLHKTVRIRGSIDKKAEFTSSEYVTPMTFSSASTALTPPSAFSNLTSSSQTFHNVVVAVSQKAVLQPTLTRRRWMEEAKTIVPKGGGISIKDLESSLPPLCSEDAEHAKEEEFRTTANCLLNAIKGSVGAKRKEENKMVIGIDLSQFKSSSGLTSLHGSFLAYFV